MDEVLRLLVQLVCYVLGEVESYELASGGHSEEVGRNLVDAPVALREFRDGAVLPQPLRLVGYEGNVVVVELVGDIPKERGGDSGVLKRDNPLLVNDLLNLRCVCLEGLEVPVLGEYLYLVLGLLVRARNIRCPLGLQGKLVRPIHRGR